MAGRQKREREERRDEHVPRVCVGKCVVASSGGRLPSIFCLSSTKNKAEIMQHNLLSTQIKCYVLF